MSSMNIFKYLQPNRHYKAGDLIFSQNDEAREMFIVKAGKVEIELNGQLIESIGEDGIFGEMALVDNSPRSASALAKTDVALLAIDEEGFKQQVHSTPDFALQVLRITTARLRNLMHKS